MKLAQTIAGAYYYCFYCCYEATVGYKDVNLRILVSYAMLSLWHFMLFGICFSFVKLILAISGRTEEWLFYVPTAIIFLLNYIFLIRNGIWRKIADEMQAKTSQKNKVLIRIAAYLMWFVTAGVLALVVVMLQQKGLLPTPVKHPGSRF